MRIETTPAVRPKYIARCACGWSADLDTVSLEAAVEAAETRHKCPGRIEVKE